MTFKKDFTIDILYDALPIGVIVTICDQYKVLKRQTGSQVIISVGFVKQNTGMKCTFNKTILEDIVIKAKDKKTVVINTPELLKIAIRVPVCDLIEF